MDRWGHRATIQVGAVLMSAALLGLPAVHRVWLLAAIQVVNGAGRGLLMTVLMSLSIRTVAPDQRATTMGVYQALYAIGMMSGPLVSGYLAGGLGLNSVFYVSGLLCLIPAVVARLAALPER